MKISYTPGVVDKLTFQQWCGLAARDADWVGGKAAASMPKKMLKGAMGGWGGSNGSRGAAELYRDAANWREALQSPRCQDGNQPARALLSIFHACALALVGTPTSTNGGVSCQSSAATTPWGN